jgi:hypothetical protein
MLGTQLPQVLTGIGRSNLEGAGLISIGGCTAGKRDTYDFTEELR